MVEIFDKEDAKVFIDQLKIERDKYRSTPTLSELETILQNFLRGFKPVMEFIPPLKGEVGHEALPEYCYIGQPMDNGKEFTAYIYLKDGLSIRTITFIYDSVTHKYMLDFIFLIFSHFNVIVNLVEVVQEQSEPRWSISVEQINRQNH